MARTDPWRHIYEPEFATGDVDTRSRPKLTADGLLTHDGEALIFRRYNYRRYLCSIKQTKRNMQAAHRCLNTITRHNLGLVYRIAFRRAALTDVEVDDAVSHGFFSLVYAADRFDYRRSVRFSTYAWRAIINEFGQPDRASVNQRHLSPVQFSVLAEGVYAQLSTRNRSVEEQVDQSDAMDAAWLAIQELPDRERHVLLSRYGLTPQTPFSDLDTLGRKFGLTKEGIRQVQVRCEKRVRESVQHLA